MRELNERYECTLAAALEEGRAKYAERERELLVRVERAEAGLESQLEEVRHGMREESEAEKNRALTALRSEMQVFPLSPLSSHPSLLSLFSPLNPPPSPFSPLTSLSIILCPYKAAVDQANTEREVSFVTHGLTNFTTLFSSLLLSLLSFLFLLSYPSSFLLPSTSLLSSPLFSSLLKEYYQLYSRESKARKAIHNKLMELQGNIRVMCRVRPVLEVERREEGGEARIVTDFLSDVRNE